MSDRILSDADIASFAGLGSIANRAEELRQREALRQHIDHLHRSDYGDDPAWSASARLSARPEKSSR